MSEELQALMQEDDTLKAMEAALRAVDVAVAMADRAGDNAAERALSRIAGRIQYWHGRRLQSLAVRHVRDRAASAHVMRGQMAIDDVLPSE